MFVFNDLVDRVALKPVAKVYHRKVPDAVRHSVGYFLNNLAEPGRVVNGLLQRRLSVALVSFWRFVINSTIGLGGIFDPASVMHLKRQRVYFGQTLDSWGAPQTAYLVLPLLGPNTLTDLPGIWVDNRLSAENSILSLDNDQELGLLGAKLLHHRSRLLSADSLIKEAFDPYIFVRQAYLQRREQDKKALKRKADQSVEKAHIQLNKYHKPKSRSDNQAPVEN